MTTMASMSRLAYARNAHIWVLEDECDCKQGQTERAPSPCPRAAPRSQETLTPVYAIISVETDRLNAPNLS